MRKQHIENWRGRNVNKVFIGGKNGGRLLKKENRCLKVREEMKCKLT